MEDHGKRSKCKVVSSEEIEKLSTIGSMYAGNRVLAHVKKKVYYLDCKDLLASFDYAYPVFSVVKKRVHEYLELNVGLTEINEEGD